MTTIVYVTKYALTTGIRRTRRIGGTKTWIRVEWRSMKGREPSFDKRDVVDSLELAQERAREMAALKIALLKKQIAALEKIVRDGAKVVEECDES